MSALVINLKTEENLGVTVAVNMEYLIDHNYLVLAVAIEKALKQLGYNIKVEMSEYII